jgi:hypothetical protein
MGAYFFFISTMLFQLALAALETGQSQQLMDFIPKDAEHQGRTTHPADALRLSYVNRWLEEKYSQRQSRPLEAYRGTQYYAALLWEVAAALWHNVEPHILRLHAKNVEPSYIRIGFDIFEHAEQSDR